MDDVIKISLLTAGKDKPYVLGLLSGLACNQLHVDFIGNDEMQDAVVVQDENVTYFNLRGNQDSDAPIARKAHRVLKYYLKLIRYAYRTHSPLFHIQWLNKFIYFDRTLLNCYYKVLGKKLVYTAHNVNMRERDGNDSIINRATLWFLYRVVDHVIVHTEKMKDALVGSYHVSAKKVSVIPFGINNTVPNSQLTTQEARDRLSLKSDEKIILFFGNIAPYKGLKYTIMALGDLKEKYPNLRLIIAGRIKECKTYWSKIERLIAQYKLNDHILKKVHFIPDEEIEIYFKAADVLVLPYKFIYQSGPLFLSYYYGLPVIASDVGSFREDIKEGETGFICASEDSRDLAEKIDRYFGSDLYHNLQEHRQSIRAYADKKYSWEKIGKKTCGVYKQVLGKMT